MSAPHPRIGWPRLDLTNRRFGLLLAKERLPKLPGTQGERWLCDCDCGNQTVVRVKDLSSGNTRSCGHLTNRARKVADQPHQTGADTIYPQVEAAVFTACRAGTSLRAAGVRRQFDGITSRSTLYRFIRRASQTWQHHAGSAESSDGCRGGSP